MLALSQRAFTIAELDATSRVRELSEQESRKLYQALRRSNPSQAGWQEHDRRLIRMFSRGSKVPIIAVTLGRTEGSVWRRVYKLRLLGRLGYISPPGGTGRYERKRDG